MKKIISSILIFIVYFNSFTLAHAGAEKWELVEKAYDSSKKTVEVTAKKINLTASNDPKYKVSVPVSASTLGKAVRFGMFGLNLYGAVSALMNGLDWVMDPATQSIKKIIPSETTAYPDDNYDYQVPTFNGGSVGGAWVRNIGQVANRTKALTGYSISSTDTAIIVDVVLVVVDGKYQLKITDEVKPNSGNNYNKRTFIVDVNRRSTQLAPSPEPETVPVTDEDLGNEIIKNAPQVITDAYTNTDILNNPAPVEVYNALEVANPTPSEEPKGKTETEQKTDANGKVTTSGDFELPSFCTWAVSVCDFFGVQKEHNKNVEKNQAEDLKQNLSFFDWIKDFFKKEDDKQDDDTEVPIAPSVLPDIDQNVISTSGQCPPPYTVDFPLPFRGSKTISFSFDTYCLWLERSSWLVKALAWISALKIVTGVRSKDE